jgi:hypothetical protein
LIGSDQKPCPARSVWFARSVPFDASPDQWIDRQWYAARTGNVHESAMMGDLTAPEQMSEQRQGVLRQYGVHE